MPDLMADLGVFARRDDVPALVRAAIAHASRQLQTGLAALQEEWARLPGVERARSDAAVHRLVFQLVEHPVCSAQQAAERLGVSRRAARDALEMLTDVGVLNRTTAARNLQVFALIDDLERTARLTQR